MKYVLYALLAWFIFQFIFRLVIPVYKTSRQIKRGFSEMQQKMQEQYQQQQQAYSTSSAGSAQSKRSNDDYIDFEEVK